MPRNEGKGRRRRGEPDPTPPRERHQREMLLFAQDMYHYLSSRMFPHNPIPKACEKSNFIEKVGKGCYYKSFFGRPTFREYMKTDYFNRPMGSREFVAWFNHVMRTRYTNEREPFTEALQALSLMFEAIVYSVEKGHTNLYKLLPFIFTDYFMQRMYPAFFNMGGWTVFRKKAIEMGQMYQDFFLSSEAGAMELIKGFKEDDASTTGVDPEAEGIDPQDLFKVPNCLRKAGFPQYVTDESNLAQCLTGLVRLRVEESIVKPALRELHTRMTVPSATHTSALPGSKEYDWRTPPIPAVYPSSSESTPPDSPKEESAAKETILSPGRKKRGSTSKSEAGGLATGPRSRLPSISKREAASLPTDPRSRLPSTSKREAAGLATDPRSRLPSTSKPESSGLATDPRWSRVPVLPAFSESKSEEPRKSEGEVPQAASPQKSRPDEFKGAKPKTRRQKPSPAKRKHSQDSI